MLNEEENLGKILQNNFKQNNNNLVFFNNKFSYSKFIYSFILFHPLFIETSVLVGKLKSMYKYYSEKNSK